jgi:hypothetical protein
VLPTVAARPKYQLPRGRALGPGLCQCSLCLAFVREDLSLLPPPLHRTIYVKKCRRRDVRDPHERPLRLTKIVLLAVPITVSSSLLEEVAGNTGTAPACYYEITIGVWANATLGAMLRSFLARSSEFFGVGSVESLCFTQARKPLSQRSMVGTCVVVSTAPTLSMVSLFFGICGAITTPHDRMLVFSWRR